MNILLTQRCVRSCPYCFASRHMSESQRDAVLSWEDLVYLVDFLRASGRRNVSLLGGEPTLHPDFPDFLVYLRERGFRVTVFTSGIMSEKTLERTAAALDDDSEGAVKFACNLNEPRHSPEGEAESIRRFLSRFSGRALARFNIYREDFDLDFLRELMDRHKLKRSLRLGLAHPVSGAGSEVVDDDRMHRMARRLLDQLPMIEKNRIELGFDCGFPLCVFSDEEFGRIVRSSEGQLNFNCGPAFDVGPDMQAWSCFPLSGMEKKSIFEFDDYGAVVDHFKKAHEKTRAKAGGIFDDCGSCRHFRKLCAGGCLARAMDRPVEAAVPAAGVAG